MQIWVTAAELTSDHGIGLCGCMRPGALERSLPRIDTELHRRVALKQMQHGHAENASSRDRFVAEAEITGNLEHPGIVPVYGLRSRRRTGCLTTRCGS